MLRYFSLQCCMSYANFLICSGVKKGRQDSDAGTADVLLDSK